MELASIAAVVSIVTNLVSLTPDFNKRNDVPRDSNGREFVSWELDNPYCPMHLRGYWSNRRDWYCYKE